MEKPLLAHGISCRFRSSLKACAVLVMQGRILSIDSCYMLAQCLSSDATYIQCGLLSRQTLSQGLNQ